LLHCWCFICKAQDGLKVLLFLLQAHKLNIYICVCVCVCTCVFSYIGM
jgi:hypothetical protein